MNQQRLDEIKARCEAEDYTDGRKLTLGGAELDAMYEQLKHARQDLPDCLAEIERLRGLIERIATDKGGNVWATFSFNPVEECCKILDLKKYPPKPKNNLLFVKK